MSTENGPVYNVELIDSLPLCGQMKQAMPSRDDLIIVREVSERTAAGYEVLLSHYRAQSDDAFRLRRYLRAAICNAEDIASGRCDELVEEIEGYLDDFAEDFRIILFNGPMVQAILAGRKTQTRRIVVVKFEGGRGMSTANRVGRYRGIDWKYQRICDVLCVAIRERWYFIYIDGKATGDHFRTLGDLERSVDRGDFIDHE